MKKVEVAIIGASGYAGLELVRLLARHPGCDLAALTSLEYPGRAFDQVFPALAGIVQLPFSDAGPEAIAAQAEVVFLAVPHQAAMGMVPGFLEKGCKVVDLSADFRFKDAGLYEKWYQAHTARNLLAETVYGLPELHREEVRGTRLVGNPGCYPTAVILGLAPLAQAGLLQPDTVIADCKSGASGAGRQALLGITFCEVNDGFRPYKVLEHRHTPEMEQELSELAGTRVKVTFTPHLVPMSRGILGTLYAGLTESRSEEELRELYRQFYQGHPFVRLHPAGRLPDTRDVRGSNFCDLALRVDQESRRVIVLSTIDNLTKGAAGQAVQNFNLMLGFPETMGLDVAPFIP
ncbi:MAG: N-acetyl-gamma-glutamyl-phosphate reductase [Desulfobaccales bacterium]